MDLRSRRPGVLNSIGHGREDSISQEREESIFSVEADDAVPPQKRCRRTVAAYVRPGQRVYPQSAYFGSPSYERAMTAKTEREVFERYLVEALRFPVNCSLRKWEKWMKTVGVVLTLLPMSWTISPFIEPQTLSRYQSMRLKMRRRHLRGPTKEQKDRVNLNFRRRSILAGGSTA